MSNKFDTSIETILKKVANSAKEYQESPAKLREWVAKEHAKIDDPRYRSYSWTAALFVL